MQCGRAGPGRTSAGQRDPVRGRRDDRRIPHLYRPLSAQTPVRWSRAGTALSPGWWSPWHVATETHANARPAPRSATVRRGEPLHRAGAEFPASVDRWRRFPRDEWRIAGREPLPTHHRRIRAPGCSRESGRSVTRVDEQHAEPDANPDRDRSMAHESGDGPNHVGCEAQVLPWRRRPLPAAIPSSSGIRPGRHVRQSLASEDWPAPEIRRCARQVPGWLRQRHRAPCRPH